MPANKPPLTGTMRLENTCLATSPVRNAVRKLKMRPRGLEPLPGKTPDEALNLCAKSVRCIRCVHLQGFRPEIWTIRTQAGVVDVVKALSQAPSARRAGGATRTLASSVREPHRRACEGAKRVVAALAGRRPSRVRPQARRVFAPPGVKGPGPAHGLMWRQPPNDPSARPCSPARPRAQADSDVGCRRVPCVAHSRTHDRNTSTCASYSQAHPDV